MNNMLIRELFEKRIDRNINPAVVVSTDDTATIEAEIGEYVFTDDLLDKSWRFLNAVANKREGKAGIWINGYYGSGKSHFIKFMHYCLSPNFSTKAFEKISAAVKGYDPFKPGNNEEITESKFKVLQKRIADLHCMDILFNVEAVTDDHSGEKLTRIFLNMFNQFRGYNAVNIPLAILLEKPLNKAGKFGVFKQYISDSLQHNWEAEAADLAGYKLETILDIAKKLLPELDVKALHSTLTNPSSYHIGITSKLIPELKEYVAEKGDNFRLVFLVDEISQYIGHNKDILLNLQSIIEEVSHGLKNQVWIALTAQQTLEEVVERFDHHAGKSDEFGKILGRFDTRISLESNDASYITKRRVLEKNATGTKALNDLYTEKKDFIQHQFKLSHDLYKGYDDADDFILSYPFVPYQFRLIADVFSAFQRLGYVITEVKNNERSVIGVTHYTVKEHADEKVGLFIAFDHFFNKLFRNNLTHIGRRVIDRALSLTYVRNNEFAQRVVGTLFMISNLEDNVLLTFPPNINNLTVLLMTELDQNKAQLQKKIKDVLKRLIEESIIREETGKFYFYSEDEIQVTNLIKNTKPTFDDRLSIVNDLINPLLRIESKFALEENDIRIGYAIDDKEIYRNGDIKVNIVLFDKLPLEEKAMNTIANDLYICLNEWFTKDTAFNTDLEWYTKNIIYFKNNTSAATGEREKTLQNFKSRNDELKSKLLLKFTEKLLEARFISLQQIVEASAVSGSQTRERYANTLRYHLERVYKFIKYAAGYARTAADLRARVAQSIQITMDGELPNGEAKVEEFILANGNEATVEELVRNFTKIPFGWKDVAVIDMVVMLNARKLRDLEYRNTPRFPAAAFIEKAITTPERPGCIVKALGGIDAKLVDDATKAFGAIFNKSTSSFPTDGYKLAEQMAQHLAALKDDYASYQDKYDKLYPFGKTFKEIKETITAWIDIRDPKRLFTELIEGQTAAKALRDKTEKTKDFITAHIAKYDEIKRFYLANEANFASLSDGDKEVASKLAQFLLNAEPASEFRVAVKQYEQAKAALTKLVDDLRKKAVTAYEKIFAELEAKATEMKVDYVAYRSKDKALQRLQSLNDITQLMYELSKAANFKAEELGWIIQTAGVMNDDGTGDGTPARKPEIVVVSQIQSSISNQEELDQFISTISTEFKKLLSQNKTIIIE